jgi:lysophospholipase L1-like esterase
MESKSVVIGGNMNSIAQATRRRTVLSQIGLGLALSACDLGGGKSAPSGGSFRSVAELAQWRPDWNILPAAETAPWPTPAGNALAPLAQALAALAQGRAQQPVLVVQFGDSHTAAHFFTSRLRERFQQRYGALGPGRMAPGGVSPAYTRPPQVRVEQSGTWQGASALRSSTPGPFGLAGWRLRGTGAGSRLVLRSAEPDGFDRFTLDVLVQPEGGSFRLSLDGETGPLLRAAGPLRRRAPVPLELPHRYREVTVELVGDGPVDFLGWGVERRGAGVLVEGHGLNGATIDMLSNLDQEILRGDLAARPPALIILAYGTNEAVDPQLTTEAYAAALADKVRLLRQMAPRSGIMLLGAPDSARRLTRAGGCNGWHPLPGLAAVQAAQRRVAEEQKLAYWNWAEVTGGTTCSLNALTRGPQRLVQEDHIHLTAEGYRASADRLFQHLLAAATVANIRT